MPRSLLPALPVLLAFGACAGGDARRPGAEVRDSAGITVVTNHAAPDTLVLDEPARRIGSVAADGAAEYAFELVSSVLPLPENRLLVVDNRGARLAVFDANGRWLEDWGRRGEGPGEHQAPMSVSVRGDTTFVWDAMLRRITAYAKDGTPIATTTVGGHASGHPILATRSGFVDEVERGQGPSPGPAQAFILRRDHAGTVTDTVVAPFAVPKIGWRILDESTGMGTMVNPPALSVRSVWTLRGDDIAWVPPGAPTIQILDADGTLRRLIHLQRDVNAPTADEKAAYFDALARNLGLSEEQKEGLRTTTTFAERTPAITALIADDVGRLWVAHLDAAQPFRRHIGSAWDVLDADGRIVRHVRFPDAFELKHVRGETVYGVETTPDGVHVVAIFDLPER